MAARTTRHREADHAVRGGREAAVGVEVVDGLHEHVDIRVADKQVS